MTSNHFTAPQHMEDFCRETSGVFKRHAVGREYSLSTVEDSEGPAGMYLKYTPCPVTFVLRTSAF